jgi:isochorismate hydrolase
MAKSFVHSDRGKKKARHTQAKIGPDVLVIAGVSTHACVRMAAIDAHQRDYHVIAAADAVASSDPEHHAVTLRYLDGIIARVLPTASVLSLIEGPLSDESL